MGKKSKAKDSNVKVNLDELVNEGKNLNDTEVNETWKQITDEIKESAKTVTLDSDISKLYEANAKLAETDKTVEETNEFVRPMEIPNKIEESTEPIVEDGENIDDVIAECTGGKEEKIEKKKPIKNDEPWYVARALRGNDYFNW